MFIVYVYITYRFLNKNIEIGDFSVYMNSTLNFSTLILNLFKNYVTIKQMCRYLQVYMEFKDNSFKYPRSKEFIKNI